MLSGSQKSDWAPAVAADEYPDQFLVAWSQPSDSLSASQIYARYVSQKDDDLDAEIAIGGYQWEIASISLSLCTERQIYN